MRGERIRYLHAGVFAAALGAALCGTVLETRAVGGARADSSAEGELVLAVHAPGEARRALVVPAELFIAAVSPAGSRVRLDEFRFYADGALVYAESLRAELEADPDFAELQRWIEELPAELTHRRAPRAFLDPARPELGPAAWDERLGAIRARLADLRARYAAAELLPFRAHAAWLPLDQFFLPGEPAGRTLELRFEIDWTDARGAPRLASTSSRLRWLGAPLGASPGFAAGLASSAFGAAALSIHAGDLHVHSCHGEAMNACSPSSNCAAESFQTSGSFSYAALKAQFQALGLDWMSATDHSYCVNSDSEYQAIVAETAALSDASFAAFPDIELSSDESGPQIGSDVGNLTCLFTTAANHMGAHQIAARIAGGNDGFLGFCDGASGDVLAPFPANVQAVRAQGGFPIVNHPTGSFAWNSFAATPGFEANMLHGVEIWNGASVSGQSGDVGRWVDWLRGGRLLYAYSGSDTHDAAFAFGATHAVLSGAPFSGASVLAALRAGRAYVSNGPALLLEVEQAGAALFMGTVQAVPLGSPALAQTARAAYDFGAATGRISIYAGGVGDAAETLVCQSAPLSGAGTFECAAVLRTDTSSWLRAYAQTEAGDAAAYTNPVFFRLGAGALASYCTAKPNSQGCLPSIGFEGTPSGSFDAPFDVTARDVLNQKSGLCFFGALPAAIPFQGAFLCVAPPTQRGPLAFSGGSLTPADCSGVLRTDVRALIQSGSSALLAPGLSAHAQYWYRDPADAAGFGTGLSDALSFTILP